MESHQGRDVTNSLVRHFNGISAESEAGKADHGQPPYVNLQTIPAADFEYTHQVLDGHWITKAKMNKDCIVGHHVEFLHQKNADAANA